MADKIQWSKIVKKAQADPEFKKALLANPREAIQNETGVTLPEGVDFVVHEQSPGEVHLVLPEGQAKDITNAVFFGGESEEDDGETLQS